MAVPLSIENLKVRGPSVVPEPEDIMGEHGVEEDVTRCLGPWAVGIGEAETEEVFTPPPPGHIPPSLPVTNLVMITWGSLFLLGRFAGHQTSVLSFLHGLHQVNSAFEASVPNSK